MKAFINRPIPRLLRYELLLKAILDETPPGHEDHDSIPQILEIIKDLGKATEPGVSTAKQKVELWRYNANLIFKPGDRRLKHLDLTIVPSADSFGIGTGLRSLRFDIALEAGDHPISLPDVLLQILNVQLEPLLGHY